MNAIKSIIAVIIAFLLTCGAVASEVKFNKSSWNEVKAKAKQEKKFIFVDAYTDWCGWCKVMDKKTFSDSKVADFMNKHFISAKFDMEKGDGKILAMKYSVSSFPSFLYFDSNGKLIYRTSGYQPPKDFLITLKEAIDPANRMKSPGISDILDLPFPDFYKAAFAKNGSEEKKFPDSTTVNKYLFEHKDWFSEVNWLIIKKFRTNEEINNFFLDNMKKYKSLYGEDMVNSKMYSVFYSKLKKAIKQKSEDGLNDILALIEQYEKKNKKSNIRFYEMKYYQGTENWKAYSNKIDEYVSEFGFDEPGKINEYCWTIYLNVDDSEIINKASEWMKNAVEKSPEWAYLDTYAALLYKAKDYQLAKKIAEQAIKKGKKDEQNVEETEKLLEKINDTMR